MSVLLSGFPFEQLLDSDKSFLPSRSVFFSILASATTGPLLALLLLNKLYWGKNCTPFLDSLYCS